MASPKRNSRPATAPATEETPQQKSWRQQAEEERRQRQAACQAAIDKACTEFGCEIVPIVTFSPRGGMRWRVEVQATAAV